MTNKVDTIVSAIEAKLIAGGIATVYRWPEQVQNIGNRYPLAFIREDRQEFIATSGQRYEYYLYISIILIDNAIRERMKTMNALQVLAFNALFTDCTLSGNVMNINPVSVDMGGLLSNSVRDLLPGHSESLSFRTIQIQCRVQDARS
jgi:hypothetical protein